MIELVLSIHKIHRGVISWLNSDAANFIIVEFVLLWLWFYDLFYWISLICFNCHVFYLILPLLAALESPCELKSEIAQNKVSEICSKNQKAK